MGELMLISGRSLASKTQIFLFDIKLSLPLIIFDWKDI